MQRLEQEVCSMKKRARKKDKQNKEAFEKLSQENCSMKQQYSELMGKLASIQQQIPESPIVIPPLSSQTNESSTAKYKLVFRGAVSEKVYFNSRICTAEDDPITVAVEDLKKNQVGAGHDLALVKVELVILDPSFDDTRFIDWSKEKFKESVIEKTAKDKQIEIKNPVFQLANGKGTIPKDATFNRSSNKQRFKLGVKIYEENGNTKERVLEGVSSTSFTVEHLPREKKSKRESSLRLVLQKRKDRVSEGKGQAIESAQPTVATEVEDPESVKYYEKSPSRKQSKPNEAPPSKQATVISQDPDECGDNSNGGTETEPMQSDVTDGEIPTATVGEQAPNANNTQHVQLPVPSSHTAVLPVEDIGGATLPGNPEGDDPQKLADTILYKIHFFWDIFLADIQNVTPGKSAITPRNKEPGTLFKLHLCAATSNSARENLESATTLPWSCRENHIGTIGALGTK